MQTFTLLMLPALIRCRLPKKCFKIRENQGIYWYYNWRRFKYVRTVILLVGINIILKDFKLRETRDITEMRAQPVKIFWSLHTSKTLFIYNVRDLFFFTISSALITRSCLILHKQGTLKKWGEQSQDLPVKIFWSPHHVKYTFYL